MENNKENKTKIYFKIKIKLKTLSFNRVNNNSTNFFRFSLPRPKFGQDVSSNRGHHGPFRIYCITKTPELRAVINSIYARILYIMYCKSYTHVRGIRSKYLTYTIYPI